MKQVKAVKEDKWVPTVCSTCYGACSILVHKVDGVVVKVEGNPESPIGNGRLCAKGVSAFMTHYDPNRVRVPLKRTNPKKGIGVDPKWQEISWTEAIETLAEKLKEIRKEDPRKLVFQVTTTVSTTLRKVGGAFTVAFGSPNTWAAGGGLHCGNGAHFFNGLTHASWSLVPDFDYANYVIYFGASKGHSAGHVANANAQKAADARARGMQMVVVDPMCNFASGKATEWVPIRVGTDAALALAMANVLLNELGIYDASYIKHGTNGPYLIGPDGGYVRDESTNKPMVWDAVDNRAKAFDDPTVKDFALEGAYQVQGVHARPAFSLLKEHVKRYTPEEVEKITSIPADKVRRLAKEFGQAARVGSTIVIDGKELPYRPACAIYFRGAQGHRNSTYNCAAIELLNQIVGASDVPGGALGFNPTCFGHPDSGRPYHVPKPCPDGLMITGTWHGPHAPYPLSEPRPPQAIGLADLFPLTMLSPFFASADQETMWEKFKFPYRPSVMINCGANSIMSVGNKETVAASLAKFDFIVSFDLFLNEFTDFADIVIPDTTHLQRWDPYPNPFIFNHPAGLGEWCWPIGQPVVEPGAGVPGFLDVMLELAERVGVRSEMYSLLNVFLGMQGPGSLDDSRKQSWPEVADTLLKNYFGPDHGLEWFKENGGLIKWPKKVEEVYWRPFVNVRVPIYFEAFKQVGEKVQAIAKRFDVKLDYSRYHPLPDWYPCRSHEVTDPQLDLYGFYYRDTLHANSFTLVNPWLDEAAKENPYSYNVTINAETARRKGLADGEIVWVESEKGRKVKGRLKLSEGIHPEGLGIAACAGHWSRNHPIAYGKGVFFNDLLEVDYEHSDPANLNLDLCVKVKVSRA